MRFSHLQHAGGHAGGNAEGNDMRTRTFLATIAIALVLSSTTMGLGRMMLDVQSESSGATPLAVSFVDVPVD